MGARLYGSLLMNVMLLIGTNTNTTQDAESVSIYRIYIETLDLSILYSTNEPEASRVTEIYQATSLGRATNTAMNGHVHNIEQQQQQQN